MHFALFILEMNLNDFEFFIFIKGITLFYFFIILDTQTETKPF